MSYWLTPHSRLLAGRCHSVGREGSNLTSAAWIPEPLAFRLGPKAFQWGRVEAVTYGGSVTASAFVDLLDAVQDVVSEEFIAHRYYCFMRCFGALELPDAMTHSVMSYLGLPFTACGVDAPIPG